MLPLLPTSLDHAGPTSPEEARAGSTPTAGELALIGDLERASALTTHQAALLRETWPHLDNDWASSPYFGTVREHTRAYIERQAKHSAGDVI